MTLPPMKTQEQYSGPDYYFRMFLFMCILGFVVGIPFIIAGSIGVSGTPQSIHRQCTLEKFNGKCYIKTTPRQGEYNYQSSINCNTRLPGSSPKSPKVTIGDVLSLAEYKCYYIPSTGIVQLSKVVVTWASVLLILGSIITWVSCLLVIFLLVTYMSGIRLDERLDGGQNVPCTGGWDDMA